jgi:FtsP/CotA-like multicopper oxidase with cupredoxin domain
VRVPELLIAPGERADVIVDFSSAAGTSLLLTNDAAAPFPGGDPVDPATTGRVLRIDVARRASSPDTTCDPAAEGRRGCDLRRGRELVRLAPRVAAGHFDARRQLVLREIPGPGGPLEVVLNNTNYEGLRASTMTTASPAPVPGSVGLGPNFATEAPRVGSTELWEVANLTEDAHPIHLHLVQFQVVDRQAMDTGRAEDDTPQGYLAQYLAALPPSGEPDREPVADGPPAAYQVPNTDGAVGGNPPFRPWLQGRAERAPANERGWKDTVVMWPGTVTRLAVRFAPPSTAIGAARPGVNLFPFDPTLTGGHDAAGNPGAAGYVWHCHILEHEDNDMMRPYAVTW